MVMWCHFGVCFAYVVHVGFVYVTFFIYWNLLELIEVIPLLMAVQVGNVYF